MSLPARRELLASTAPLPNYTTYLNPPEKVAFFVMIFLLWFLEQFVSRWLISTKKFQEPLFASKKRPSTAYRYFPDMLPLSLPALLVYCSLLFFS